MAVLVRLLSIRTDYRYDEADMVQWVESVIMGWNRVMLHIRREEGCIVAERNLSQTSPPRLQIECKFSHNLCELLLLKFI